MSVIHAISVLLAAAPQAGATPSPAPSPTVAASGDPSEAQRIAQSARLGRLVYALDRAAWVSSNTLTAQVPKDQLTGVGGYVVEVVDGGTLRVTYYRGAPSAATAYFTADVRDSKVVASQRLATPVPLTPAQAALATARDAAAKTAVSLGYAPCTPAPFNTVVLPPRAGGPFVVYLLTAQQDARRYMMGGNYRIMLKPDGTVLMTRPYGKSCMTLDTAQLPPGARPTAIVINHLLDPVPTEIHVFASYSMHLPLYVMTPDQRLWRVQGDRMAIVERSPAPPPK